MSHHIYQVEGFVIGTVDTGESNRYLYLFTKDLGLVGASAQGLRELKSKLRFALQEFSFAHVDLVRGKGGWRIVGANEGSHFRNIAIDPQKKIVSAKIFSLIKRMVGRDEGQERLFSELHNGLLFLNRERFSLRELQLFEIMMVARMLKHLGYMEGGEGEAISRAVWNKEVLNQIEHVKSRVLRDVNRALQESHL